ncbi:MAG: alpha/beta fold hydrolase [Eubacteriales bacterium]|nr:alpha/beta fold hydrolase [Eubacteriales bacterium]
MSVFFIALISLIGILLFAGCLAGLYFYNLALDRHTDKGAALGSLPPAKDRVTMEQGPRFLDATAHEDIYETSFDGLKLHAIVVPQDTQNWVVIAHGYTGAARGMGNIAKRFHEMGYSLLLPDARGHGQSEGNYIGMGWFDRLDIRMWINRILAEHADAHILLYGISMGGATVMMAAGEPLPMQVKGMIEDCGFSSVCEEMRHQLINVFHYPAYTVGFVLFFADFFTRLRAGYSLHDGEVCAQLKKATLPMLFLHGEKDRYVPCWMLDKVYASAASRDKRKLSFPGAVHGGAAISDPDRYWAAVTAFARRVAPLNRQTI